MTFPKRMLGAAVVAFVALGAAACGEPTSTDLSWELQVALTDGSNRPSVGDQIRFGAFILRPANSVSQESIEITEFATWTVVGQPGIVTLTQSGGVTAVAPGAVAIEATYGGKTANMSLIVE